MLQDRLIITICLLCLSFVVVAQTTCDLIITGEVIDNHDDQPLVGAVVKIGEQTAITNSDGVFSITNLCEGSHSITISHLFCEDLTETIELQSSTTKIFYLEHHSHLIEQVTIEGMKKRGELARATTTVTEQEVKERQGGTFGDLLADVEGVTLLKTGSTITKPVIHGLHSQRILTINNGIRMEGQQWGLEHAPTIDPYAVQQVSVIKGAGAVEYGSDGVGGVLLVEPQLLPDEYGTDVALSTAAFSNGRGGNVSANISGKESIFNLPISFVLQGSLKKHGNLKAPDYHLDNTGVREQNFSLRAGYVGDEFGFEGQLSQYNSQLGILQDSHIGNERDLQAAIERGQPLYDFGFQYGLSRPRQKILHEIGQIKGYLETPFGKLTAEFGRQYNSRGEFDTSEIVPGLELKTETFTVQSALDYDLSEQLNGKTGVQLLSQDYRFSGYYLIPEYQQESIGAFTFHQYNFNDKLTLEAGLRYDRKEFDYQIPLEDLDLIEEEQIEFDSIFTFEEQPIGEVNRTFANLWTGSAGLTFDASEAVQLSTILGYSARQPLPNELFSDGVHHGTALYEVGDPNLTVEKATNLQLNASIQTDKITGSVSTYLNSIEDYIYPFTDANSGFVGTIRGTFPTQFTNQSNVTMLGVDYRFSKPFLDNRLVATTGGSFLHAQDNTINQPVIFMPSNRLNHSLNYALKQNLSLGLRMHNVFEQKRIPTEEFIQDYQTPPPSYSLVDFTANYNTSLLNKTLELSATVDNIFNTRYRDYLDRFRYYVDSPGMNAGLRMNYFLF